MRQMGGLRKVLPRTYLAFLVGSLALVGIPPLSGFFSKDSILASALASGSYGQLLFVAGLAGALLTGLYTFRMFFVVWGGEPSPLVREHAEDAHGHGEGHWTMTAPVAILAVLAVVGGWLQIAGVWHPFADWLHTVAEPLVEPTVTQDYVTSVFAVGLGVVGIAVAWLFYGARRRRTLPRAAAVRDALEHKLYFDELYDLVFYRPSVVISNVWRRWVEEPLIGGSITGVTAGARRAGALVGDAQTGYLRTYALAIVGAVALLTVLFVGFR
jgi:NADH-quinone oxidoreductase subunit L